MARTTSVGKCALCGKTFSKAAMPRHLEKCVAEHPPQTKGKPADALLLKVEGQDIPFYWMDLAVRADSKLSDLDEYLRDVWLECCGHLSAFTIKGTEYTQDTGGVDGMWSMMGMAPSGGDMKARLSEVLGAKGKFQYVYDFGSSTRLSGQVLRRVEMPFPGQAKVKILARNLAPSIPCSECGKPAVALCAECIQDGAGALCPKHAEEHEHDEMLLPVVNSPRMGECGYSGPEAPERFFDPGPAPKDAQQARGHPIA